MMIFRINMIVVGVRVVLGWLFTIVLLSLATCWQRDRVALCAHCHQEKKEMPFHTNHLMRQILKLCR